MSRATLLHALKHLVTTQRDFVRSTLPWAHALEAPHIHIPEWFLQVALEQPEIAELEGYLFNQGNSVHSLGASFILSALIAKALDEGADVAIASMYDFIDIDCNRCIEVLLLEGIHVVETTEVADGIFLCPVSAVPSSTLRSYLTYVAENTERPPLSMAHLLHEEKRNPGAALFQIREVEPKFYREMPQFPLMADIPPIHDIANVLAILGPTSPLTCKSFSELADGEFLKGFVGFSWGTHREETRVYKNVSVTSNEIKNFVPVIRRYLALSTEMKLRLRVPLHRLNEAVRHGKLEDRALDLGIALESLLLGGDLGKEKITSRLKRRGGLLLAAEKSQIAALEQKFSELYDFRSRAAHDGDVTAKGASREHVETALIEGLSLCAAAIRKIIERGSFPEWNRSKPARRRLRDNKR
ncbi:hypothetical protein [Paraburkholderia sp. D1E]|uniref:hypothetical protein n=1 Tax=Paraburkholderia sp. D1E TaxID=3461398 RepID=UPI00404545B9